MTFKVKEPNQPTNQGGQTGGHDDNPNISNPTGANEGNDGGSAEGDNIPEPIVVEGLPTVQIDDADHFITEDGRVVDKEGKHVYSREEFDEIRANSLEVDIPLIQRYSGVELVGEDGKSIEFENTIQGIAKREAYIKEHYSKVGATQAIQSFFDANPIIKDVYQHYAEKGTLDNFKPTVNYAEVQLDKDNKEQLEKVILEAEVKKGNTEAKAKKLIDYYNADNRLFEEATDAKAFLVQKQTAEEKDKVAVQQNARKAAEETQKKYYGIWFENGKEIVINNEGSLYNKVVSKGIIGDVKIPESGIKVTQPDGTIKTVTRRAIFDYIALSVDDRGNSQAELDDMKYTSNVDNRVLRFLHNLTGGDMSSLILKSIADKRIKDIPRFKSGRQPSRQSSSVQGTPVLPVN